MSDERAPRPPRGPARPQGIAFVAGAEDAGRRLDQVLAARIPDLSRRRARVLLDLGGVFVDGRRTKVAGRAVAEGEKIQAFPGGALARATKATGAEARARDERALPAFTIVHEDDAIVVVDKPAGLLTAPTPESDRNNLQSLLARDRPALFLVHRIDLETSGLLVFAKTEAANRTLGELFRTHDLVREYLVAVAGAFPDRIQRVDRPLAGKRAVTHFAVETRAGDAATLVRARLETGRTHQVRLHLLAVGHPVLGDPRYGARGAVAPPPRMALHATKLAFAHPRTRAPVSFESPWPAELAAWWASVAGTPPSAQE